MKEIEYIEINGLLYPKLTLPPQKEIHLEAPLPEYFRDILNKLDNN